VCDGGSDACAAARASKTQKDVGIPESVGLYAGLCEAEKQQIENLRSSAQLVVKTGRST